MHPERVRAGREDIGRERVERHLRVLVVDADAALHRHRDLHRALHGGDAVGDQRRRLHQAGAERARLHAVGRAADIEVDLVIAEGFADPRRLGELVRIGTAELQRDRMLLGVEAEQPVALAVDHRVGHHHLGVEQRAARQLAMEEAAMPVRPVHHRRDCKSVVVGSHISLGDAAHLAMRLSQVKDWRRTLLALLATRRNMELSCQLSRFPLQDSVLSEDTTMKRLQTGLTAAALAAAFAATSIMPGQRRADFRSQDSDRAVRRDPGARRGRLVQRLSRLPANYRSGYRYDNGWWFPAGAFVAGALIGGAIANNNYYGGYYGNRYYRDRYYDGYYGNRYYNGY